MNKKQQKYETPNDYSTKNLDWGKRISYTLEDLGAPHPPKMKSLKQLVRYVEGENGFGIPLKLQAEEAIEQYRSTLKGQRLKDFNIHYPRNK
jgi:hypothetical protein